MTSGKFYCNKCDITFPGEYESQQRPRRSCPTCHKSCDLTKTNVKQKSIPPQNTAQEERPFIDDPDELLMSVAVRELNKPNPDPRWANVLITTRKENIGTSKKEGNIRSKFKSMNIKDIAKISSGKPTNISLKPDLEESS